MHRPRGVEPEVENHKLRQHIFHDAKMLDPCLERVHLERSDEKLDQGHSQQGRLECVGR